MVDPAEDPSRLRAGQYRTDANLRARVELHERFGTNPRGWYQWVLDQLDLPAGARVLEVGCGGGGLWVRNAGRVPAGWRLLLSDLSPGMVAAAMARVRAPAWSPTRPRCPWPMGRWTRSSPTTCSIT